MAWNPVQSVSGTGANVSSLTVTYVTANLTAGTKLTATVAAYRSSAPSVSGIADAASNAMTQIATVSNGSGPSMAALWAMDTPAADAGTKPPITATFGGSGTYASMLIGEVSGLLAGNTTAMRDGTWGTGAGSGGTPSSPAYTSTAANEWLVAVYGDDGNSVTWTKPATFTADPNGVNGSSATPDVEIAWKNSANGAETGAAYSMSGGANWSELLGAFKLATGVDFTATPGYADGAGAAYAAAGAAGAATSALYAGSATGISGSWSNTGNATGSGQGTYATWTDSGAGTSAVLELATFNAQAPVPAGSSITQVNCVVRHGEAPATSVASVTAQAYSGTTPVGSPQPLTAADAVHDDTVTFTGLTHADLADLRVRVTVTRD